jgi:hypothetical protein
MTQEQFEREKAYGVTLSIARSMLKSGLITEQEYRRIEVILVNKYRPILGSLRR